MKSQFAELVASLTARTLDGPGHISASLRREVTHYAAEPKNGNNQIPPVLIPYLTKVAMHSYRVTDDDVMQLKEAGYSEEELYEITVCAAFGAGLTRLNHGLELLNN